MIARQQVDAARSATFQTDTAGALAQAQRSALTANVLFATAGAAALGGALTYLLGAPPGAADPRVISRARPRGARLSDERPIPPSDR